MTPWFVRMKESYRDPRVSSSEKETSNKEDGIIITTSIY